MKTDKEKNPYFKLHYGHKVLESKIVFEAHPMINAIKILEDNGDVEGQYTLPDPETGISDVLLYMPEKVKARKAEIEERLEKVREELQSLI